MEQRNADQQRRKLQGGDPEWPSVIVTVTVTVSVLRLTAHPDCHAASWLPLRDTRLEHICCSHLCNSLCVCLPRKTWKLCSLFAFWMGFQTVPRSNLRWFLWSDFPAPNASSESSPLPFHRFRNLRHGVAFQETFHILELRFVLRRA